MQDLADWLMKLVARGAPAKRADWAKAMQAEFAELDRRQFEWALGCWLAVTGWRLRADLGYFGALAVASLAAPTALTYAFLSLYDFLPAWTPRESFYLLCMAPAALVCFALGAVRPKRILTTVMVVRVVDMATTLRIFASMGHPFHSPADVFLHLHIMDLPFAVGYSIWIASDLACAWIGGQLRQAFTRRLSAHA